MKIVQLDIQGFRSLKNVSWRPGDLNVVIGPNGSGKSNLLRMLNLISMATEAKLNKYVQVEGGMKAIVWDGQVRNIKFIISSSLDFPDSFVSYSVNIERSGSDNGYTIEEEKLTTPTMLMLRKGPQAAINYTAEQTTRNMAGVSQEDELFLPQAISPLLDTKPLQIYHENVSSWTVYQDIRTDQNALIRQSPVSRLEQQVAPDGQDLINVLHTLYTTDRKFKQDINDAMFAAFGADFDELIFPPAADQRIQMRVRWKTLKREQSTADLSDGTLRFLFLMTVLASPNPPPLIAIDEPETGLHPSMLPIIAEFAVEAATRTQVIFTTHSDQFLSAFRDVRPIVTIAKWDNGETTLTTVEDSELAYWVEDYSLGSLFRSGELENLAS